ncbi:MAG: OsmC family protein, partial [Balneolaceae bacterium]
MSTTTIETKRTDQELGLAISQVVKKISENPDYAKIAFNATSKLELGFLTDIQVRNFNFKSDEPEGLGGTDAGPNPVEYVLGALAACQEIVIKAHAVALGIDVKEVSVEVEGNIDLN